MQTPTNNNKSYTLTAKRPQEFRNKFEGYEDLMQHLEAEGYSESFGYHGYCATMQKWWRKMAKEPLNYSTFEIIF